MKKISILLLYMLWIGELSAQDHPMQQAFANSYSLEKLSLIHI